MRRFIPIVVTLFAIACFAADAPQKTLFPLPPVDAPTSAAAVDARKAWVASTQAAAENRDKQLAAAGHEYIAALDSAPVDDEAIAIFLDKKAAEATVAANSVDMPPPQSNAGAEPKKKYDAARTVALDGYTKDTAAASAKYVADLDAAIKAATALGADGLDESVRIEAEKIRLANQSSPAAVRDSHLSSVRSVIYICDGSGSLVGGKDEALRVGLKKAIAHLLPAQSFNVLIFQSGERGKKFQSLGPQLLMGTPNNKKKLFDFVDNKMTFHGTTDPLPAIEEAFREQPEMIFLLTDGSFENNDPDEKDQADGPGVVAKIAALNKDKHVHVNTVLLLGNKKEIEDDEMKGAERIMKQIARENAGTYIWTAADDMC